MVTWLSSVGSITMCLVNVISTSKDLHLQTIVHFLIIFKQDILRCFSSCIQIYFIWLQTPLSRDFNLRTDVTALVLSGNHRKPYKKEIYTKMIFLDYCQQLQFAECDKRSGKFLGIYHNLLLLSWFSMTILFEFTAAWLLGWKRVKNNVFQNSLKLVVCCLFNVR